MSDIHETPETPNAAESEAPTVMHSTRLGRTSTTLETHPLKIAYQVKPGMVFPAGTEVQLAPVYVQQLSQAGYLEAPDQKKKTKSDR